MKIVELMEKALDGQELKIFRPVDLEALKEHIMSTDEFKDVIVFNVIYDRKNVKTTLMDPKKDKLNLVVNIYSMHLSPGIDGKVVMLDCYEDTIIRN
jgi:hypothetical protein